MPENKNKKKKSRLAFPLGLLIVILAVFGAVNAAGMIKKAISSAADNSAERAGYAEFLEPVVMFDPEPFDDISTADIGELVNISVWSLVMNADSSEKYSYSAGTEVGVLIPEEEVTAEFNRLFGSEVALAETLPSLDMSGYDITYDSAQKGFIIPITANETAYVPNVTALETRGDSIILTVELIAGKAWAEVNDNGFAAPQADKVLTVTLRSDGNDYYVAALQVVGGSAVADISSPPPTLPSTTAPPVTETAEKSETSVETTEHTTE